MTEVLVIVGLFVFFISVYGAVIVGGTLLEELDLSESAPTPRTSPTKAVSGASVLEHRAVS